MPNYLIHGVNTKALSPIFDGKPHPRYLELTINYTMAKRQADSAVNKMGGNPIMVLLTDPSKYSPTKISEFMFQISLRYHPINRESPDVEVYHADQFPDLERRVNDMRDSD